jgi:hypothetical protein
MNQQYRNSNINDQYRNGEMNQWANEKRMKISTWQYAEMKWRYRSSMAGNVAYLK